MRKFLKMVLNEHIETFVVYVTFLSLSFLLIHLLQEAQINLLFGKEVIILVKYLHFSNFFLKENALVLPKLTIFNQYRIKLLDNQ